MTASTDATEVTGLRISTPGNWFALHLPDGPQDVDAVLDQQSAKFPVVGEHREQLRSMLLEIGDATNRTSTLFAYAAIIPVTDALLPAVLLGSVVPSDTSIHDLAEELRAGSDPVMRRTVETVELAAGPAVRVHTVAAAATDDPDREIASLLVQYYVPMPSAKGYVVLTFNSAAVALTGPLTMLFFQIAESLTFDAAE